MYKLKVAFLSEFQSRHGGENSLLVILPQLVRRGIHPVVVAPNSGDFAEAVRACGIDLVDFRRTDNMGLAFSQQQSREALAEILQWISPDMVHANSLAMGRLSGPVARDLKLPSISHLRDIVRLNRQAVTDLNAHSRLIAVSHATKDYHIAQEILPEKCRVIYNGVDTELFQFRQPTGFLHRELQLPNNAVLIGNIGQIGLRKGHIPLFLAMQMVIEKRPETHLVMIGKRWSAKAESIEYEQMLHQMASQPLLHGHVHFLETRNDIPAIMNELTLLAHTARQEPLGRVLLEAAASELAVMATRVGGTHEIFEPLETQNPVPAAILLSDPSAKSNADFASEIAQHIEYALDHEPLCRQMVRHARLIAETRFNLDKCADSLLALYSETL